MSNTKADIKQIAEIADHLRELGVPEKTCLAIDRWNKKQQENLSYSATLA